MDFSSTRKRKRSTGAYANSLMSTGTKASWGKKKPARKSYKKGIGKPGTLKAMVRKEVLSMLDHKSASYSATITLTDASINAATGVVYIPLTPQTGLFTISQGSGQGDRIGNRIRIRKATIKTIIYPLPYDATNNPTPLPYDVRSFVIKNKQAPYATIPAQSALFQLGDSVVAPTGGLTDQMSPINKDLSTVYEEKRYKLGAAVPALAANAPYYALGVNNDYRYNVMVTQDITKYLPTVFDFNDTNNYPITASLFLGHLISAADGSIHGYTAPVKIAYVLNYDFTDA